MSIVSVDPVAARRRSQYRNSVQTHFLMFLVTSNNATDGTAAALVADGIPTDGDAFVNTDSTVCYLTGIDVDPRDNSDRHFEVQCQFDSLGPTAPEDNPLDQSPGFSWTYTEATETYFTDNTPESATPPGPYIVANSAGEAFEQLRQRERGELQIVMTRNELENNAATNDQYSHTINSTTITLDGTQYAIGTLKLSPIAATKTVKTLRDGSGFIYYAKTYTFKARHQGWHDRPLDVGFNELVGDPNKQSQSLRRIVDAAGNPVTKPWPLNGSGLRKPNVTDAAAVIDLQPYSPYDWTPLTFG